MDWEAIVKFFVSITGVSAVIIYIAKKMLDKSLDIAIEKYKGELDKQLATHKADLDKENLKFRSDMDRIAIEHQIRYSKLHEERGQIIKELYQKLYELEKSLGSLTTMFQGPEWITETEREEDSRDKLESLLERIELNRIYFSNGLCKTIDDLLKKAWEIINEMHAAKNEEQQNQALIDQGQYVVPDRLREPLEKWIRQEKEVKETIGSLKNELTNQFRSLLGVEIKKEKAEAK